MIALLSGVVLVLIVCHAPKAVINIYESYQMLVYGSLKFKPFWCKLLIKFSHLLLGMSSAFNILIYSYKDFKFRSVLLTECNSCTNQHHRQDARLSIVSLTKVESTRVQEEEREEMEKSDHEDEEGV